MRLPTIRQAIGVLRAKGLLESRHGIGTFVKEDRRLQRRSRRRYGRAGTDQQLLTAHLRHEIVFAGLAPVPAHIAEAMGEEPGAEVIVRRRHRFDRQTGRPEEIGASYLPTAIAAGTFLEEPAVVPKALFLCVEELSGKTYTHAHDQWSARMPTAEEPTALDPPTGAPVAHVVIPPAPRTRRRWRCPSRSGRRTGSSSSMTTRSSPKPWRRPPPRRCEPGEHAARLD
ncbi:MAG: GntR family transcriptional regulator [Mycobacteriales bacterium]